MTEEKTNRSQLADLVTTIFCIYVVINQVVRTAYSLCISHAILDMNQAIQRDDQSVIPLY